MYDFDADALTVAPRVKNNTKGGIISDDARCRIKFPATLDNTVKRSNACNKRRR
ncbi:unnamed protein product [Schistosoma mattheei]|uniref:Uncharacterized protein n=1 Tax=Schistosoma mattheei TaxID=31246 RepID=A0A3P8HVF9_9TREM|nr:unnamed protein product [Schistosoma mattheei]